MIDKAAPGVGGYGGFDDFGAEGNAVAGLVDAGAQFVVVGEMIDQGFETADFGEAARLTASVEPRP